MKISNIVLKGITSYKKLPAEKKSIIWYAVCNVFQKGIVFLSMPIVTRLLTTDEYGIYSVFISWRDILIIFTTLNLYYGVFTKLLVDNIQTQNECTSCIQGLEFTITAIAAIIYFLFSDTFNSLLHMNTLSMTLMFGYFFFYPPFYLWCTRQRVNNKYIPMVFATMFISFSTILVTILLLLFTNLKENAVILGDVGIYIIIGVFFFIFNAVKGKTFYDKKFWIFSLKYNIPLVPHYLAIIVLGQADRLMINAYCGESKAGIYSLAYQISKMMNILFYAINSSFVPQAYGYLRDNKLKELNNNTMPLMYIGLLTTTFAILVAPEIVWVLGGNKYMEAIYILPSVCTGVLITFYYSFFANIEFYFSKTHNIMVASVLSAVINVFLNWVFIPRFGYIAAGYTTLVSYLFLLIFHYIFARKIAMDCFDQNIYSGKKIFVIISLSVAISILLLSIYKYFFIRYMLIIIIAFICIIIYKYKNCSFFKRT